MSDKNKIFSTKTTLRIRNKIVSLESPLIMGIVNLTPDSFYSMSRASTEKDLLERVEHMVKDGVDILDLGAYSTRPNAEDIAEPEEITRLLPAILSIRQHFPMLPISVDTFRSEVARQALDLGADMVNDVYGGRDEAMFNVVAQHQVPYVLMHTKGTAQNMNQLAHYDDLWAELYDYFSSRLFKLNSLGVHDVIIDPGFGFAKTVAHNYEILNHLDRLSVLNVPILAGLSRKSMIYKVLDNKPEDSLNGTSILNTIALQRGASILRVHDVKEAVECVKLTRQLNI